MAAAKSYYELLGVPPTADLQTLKKAFYRLSKALHPDTTLLPAEESAKKFHQVCEAYEFLSDPIKRRFYDQTLRERNLSDKVEIKELELGVKLAANKIDNFGNRRPLSGGELLSLMLLCIAVFISLLLAIGFAVLDGRELQIAPSWLYDNQSFAKDTLQTNQDVDFASG